jgi:asparagine synthase (glutamine-hydrolysing)
MCGIAGGTGPDTSERRRVIEAQLATLCRRGPDASGYLPGDGATVGQTRLSVIDVAHGDPPLTDESGLVRVALNGEIYNFRQLRDALLAEGHSFGSYCDTEVIAHLAESLEPLDLARRLEGMFAFAVWDARQQRLVLGRDRMGKKPLYYWTDGRDLVFGSEIKALLADPRVPRRFAPEQLPAYLSLGYVPTPATFFEGIRSVPPASVLTWENGVVEIQRYWDVMAPRREDMLQAPAAEQAATLRAHLRSAVERRLIADVPLGAFLSGGVDSAAVVGLMSELQTAPVQTFCIGFDEPRYDERRWARLVSQRFGTEHIELVVEPDASGLLDEVLTACDQPFADSSALPTYLLAEMTRRHVTVALSGDGGDELFAGYERFAAALGLARAQQLPAPVLRAAAALGGRLTGGDLRGRRARIARLLRHAAASMPDAYGAWVQVFEPDLVERLVGGSGLVQEGVRETWERSDGAPLLSRLLDLNRRTYLLDDLLVKVDRMSMAHGLEVRSPLLDRELLEYAVRIPPRELVRGMSLKRLFKRAVADLVPEEILSRPKSGFGVPMDDWFRGPLAAESALRLGGSGARIHRYLNAEEVRRLLSEHDRGVAAHGQRLWSLLMLERFLEREGW